MTEIIEAVKSLGFPIIVAGYLLLRMERTVKELNSTLGGLRTTLAVLVAPWNGTERRRAGGRQPWEKATGTDPR